MFDEGSHIVWSACLRVYWTIFPQTLALHNHKMAATVKKDIKRKQCFKREYTEKFEFILRSQRGENYARCTLCSADFSISHSGIFDVSRHVESGKHRSIAESKSSNHNIKQFMSSEDLSVIRAETLWTDYIVKHNLPFASSDDTLHFP